MIRVLKVKNEAPARKRVNCLRARGVLKSSARVVLEVGIIGVGQEDIDD